MNSASSSGSTTRSPAELAQAQLDAYNAKDLDAFCACYADDVRVWRMPDPMPRTSGISSFRESYASGPFANPAIRAEVRERLVMGSKVVDYEWVHGRSAEAQPVMVVYHCRDGLIHEVYFFSPD